MATAHGGQVLLSGAAVELLRAELPEGVELRDMGEHYLKGLLRYALEESLGHGIHP